MFVMIHLRKKHLFVAARAFFALLLLAAAYRVVAGQSAVSKALPFSQGEQLVYQAEFKRALLRGVDVAEFRFSATTERVHSRGASGDDPIVVRLVGDVVTKGLFLKLVGFHFHEHVESVVDPSPFTALRTNKLEEQGKRAWTSEAVFDHQARKVTWTLRDSNQTQAVQTSSVEFSEPIQDVLTVIYFLRTVPLEVGKSFDIPLSDSGRVFRFSVAVLERKQINTVLGRLSAVRVEPSLFGENGLVRKRGTLSIWITEDSRHLPIKAQLKVDIGTFDIKLKRVSYREAH